MSHRAGEAVRVALVAPLITTVPPRGAGGTERVVHDLAEALGALDVSVTLYAADGSAGGARLRAQGPSLLAREGAPPGMPAAMEAVMMGRLRADEARHDVLHFHTEFMHAPTFAHRLGRTLTTIHWRADEADREHFLAGFPDLPVAAISASQAGQLGGGRAMGVVHHGIDLARFRPVLREEGRLAFIGRMTDQKRPELAVAIAHAAGLPLALAGAVDIGNPGWFAERVAPGLDADRRWIGEVDDAGKQRLLGGATALLFPVDWPEPFGLVMIEAMACGTPVIAWPMGAVPEVVEDGVTGFLVRSTEEAVAAVGRARGLDRARIRARFEARFGRERMARDYLAIYRRLLAEAA